MDVTNFKQIRSETNWITAYEEEIPIKRMEMSHLQNTIIFLTNKQKACDDLELGDITIRGKKANDWIDIMRTELKYRKDPKSVISPLQEEVKEEKEASIML